MKNWKQALIVALSRFLCVALHASYRYRIVFPEHRREAEALHPARAFAIASWHQNCFAGILAHAGQGIALLVSRSFDGAIVSAVAERLGNRTVRGSSRKGGREALETLMAMTRSGQRSAFTVDGPKGPIFEVKRGIFELSAATGAPVLPLLTVGDRYWTLSKSWDKFRLPRPFTRVTIIYGKPFVVPQGDLEQQLPLLSRKLKAELVELEALAISRGFTRNRTIWSNDSESAAS